ncbi:unnamed protein product [Adineta steineri]|uniref:Uncharacterized protein n=1 Tax=Adineta steineri TaxID=433720 RepID=A0A815J9H7_9BILA|nr:unnamed protein product [Adineta steineri]
MASYFRIVETFCSLANETINDAKERFLSRNLINSQLLTSNLFYSQINSSTDTFKQSTKTEFLDRTNLTNVLLHSNQYLSRTITNTRLKSIFQNMSTGLYSVKMLILALYTINTSNDKCYCVIDSTCHLNRTIYDEDQLYSIDTPPEGVNIGCSIINTAMQSSLICWFNKNCIYQARRFVERYNISVYENSTILLDRNLSSRYHPNTTIETIFNEMMIEEWNFSRSFASYFLKCKPSFCSVTYHKKANIIYIITVIIGLIGGINVILNLISPLIIKIIFKIINKLRRQRPSQSLTEEPDDNHLICPCTEISIPYEDIINITVDYHQICKSHFIQSSWYDRFSLANIGLWSSYSNIDSVSIAVSYFRILETFCSLANETINDAKERFLTRNLINSQLLTSNLFYSQINSSIDTFKQSTKTEFLDRANLTNVLLHSNQYLSRTITNTRLRSINQNITGLLSIKMLIFALYIVNTNNDKCYCVIDSTCHLNLSIRDECETYNIVWPIEGINLGCSIIDTVMQSSLICWFNKSCIYELRRRVEKYNISVHENSTILLDRNLSSRYYPNTPIEEIFNEMMIEEWNIFRSFASYFLKCKPLLCSVTYQKKANIIYIITVIIGLIGGINVILNLISPLIIKIIFKIINKLRRQRSLQNQTEEQDNNYQNDEICNNAVCNLMKRLINRLLLLNLFDDESTHIETIRRQRISTRVYIVVLSISMCIIAMYTMFSDRHKPQLFLNPSQNDYNRLLTSYSESLKCPCKNISIEYKHFIQINTTFHAVCSSDFISKRWHDYLFGRANWYYYDRRDIRVRGASYFLFLSKLCQISQTTINNALNQFLNTTFINTHMISISEFDSQINDIISQFKNNTLIIFSRRLKLFRDTLNGNAFVSSYSLNWYFYREYNSTSDINPIQPVKMTNKCSCGTRSDCIDPGGVYDTLNNTAKFLIPGWNVGCSVVETLLHSTFECLYDQICLNSLLSNTEQYTFEHSHYINISAMSFLNHSHFKPNTTIQNIADELFVEEWNNITSYSSFYKQCNPQECSYKIERDNYFASISSNILGLYGGLTVVLRFSIPFVIEIIFKIRNRCRRNTVVPTE